MLGLVLLATSGCAARQNEVTRELTSLRERIAELEAARQRDNERLESIKTQLVAFESADRPPAAVKSRPNLPVVRIRPRAKRVVVEDSRESRRERPDRDNDGPVATGGVTGGEQDDSPRPLLKLYETPGLPVVSSVGGSGGGVPVSAPQRRRRSIDLASVNERLPIVPIPSIVGTPDLSATPAALRLGVAPTGPPVEDAISRARAQVQSGECGPALQSLAKVLRTSPEHPLASEAMLLRARCYRRQGAHLRAIGEIERMARRYPRSGHGAQALMEMAEAYVSLGDLPRAREVFGQVLRQFPRSRAASRATRRVQELGRVRRARED